MIEIFIDTDVLIDLLAERTPYYNDAAIIFSLADNGLIKIYISSLCFSNIHYIISKLKSKNESIKALRKLRILVNVLNVNANTIDSALNSDFKDFEDAIQYFTALQNQVSMIITRNTKDYNVSQLPVKTPAEFIKFLKA